MLKVHYYLPNKRLLDCNMRNLFKNLKKFKNYPLKDDIKHINKT